MITEEFDEMSIREVQKEAEAKGMEQMMVQMYENRISLEQIAIIAKQSQEEVERVLGKKNQREQKQ